MLLGRAVSVFMLSHPSIACNPRLGLIGRV